MERALFLILFLTFAYFYQGGFSNSNSHFDLSLALAFQHKVSIDSFHFNTLDKAFSHGHFFSEKAPASSYLALPIPILFSFLIPTSRLLTDEGISNTLMYLATILSVSLISAFAAIVFKRFLCKLNPNIGETDSIILTFLLFCGTIMFPYSTALFGHQIAASFLLFGAYFGFCFFEQPSSKRLTLSILFLELAVLTEYPAAVPAGLLGISMLYWAYRRGFLKYLRWSAIFAVLPVLFLMVHNYFSFGSPFALGYGLLQETPFASEMSKGFFGIALPSLDVLFQLLFGLYRGLFIYCPILLVALFSYCLWPKYEFRFVGVSFLVGAFGTLLLNSSYTYWQGGVCFGPRHLICSIPLLALGIAYFPRNFIRKPWFIALALISLVINLLGTSTTIYVDEFDPRPLTNSYMSLLKGNLVSINPMGVMTSVEDSGMRWENIKSFPWESFNLGELIGLRGFASILPLLLLWMIFFYALLKWPAHSARHGERFP